MNKVLITTILSAVIVNTYAQTNTTAIGHHRDGSNYSFKGFNSVHVGAFSGYSAADNNSDNVFVGYKAGYSNAGSHNNVFIGSNAGLNSRLSFNVFVGSKAGQSTSTGTGNVLLGYQAAVNNTSGSGNIAIGEEAGLNLTTGSYNIFMGKSAAINAAVTGRYNISIGHQTSNELTSGEYNVFLGWAAGNDVTTGQNNIFIGKQAGNSIRTGSKNVFMGYQAGYNETSSNKLYIDNSSTSSPLIWGDFNTNELKFNGDVQISGSLTTDFLNSDLRLKSGAYIDDDETMGGNDDDWLKMSGFIEMSTSHDKHGIVLREKESTNYMSITQKGGWSYLADNNTYENYFLRGNGDDVEVKDKLTAASISSTTYETNGGHMNVSAQGYGMNFQIDTDNNSANSYRWYGNGLEQMQLTDDGRLGIGIVPSAFKFHVAGDIYADGGWLRTNGQRGIYNQTYETHIYAYNGNYWRTRSDKGLIIANKANDIKGYLYHDNVNSFGLLDGDSNWGLRMEKDDYTSFLINNSEKMRIHSDGNVGIGTGSSALSNLLDVNGGIDINDYIRHNDDPNTLIGFDQNDNIILQTNGETRFEVTSEGQVLVGGEKISTTAQNGIAKFANVEPTVFTSELQSDNFTYLAWDRNSDGGGFFNNGNRPMFMYWDNDESEAGYLVDTRNMLNLKADLHSLDVISGTINSPNSDLNLKTAGVSALSISNQQNVAIDKDLSIGGSLVLNKSNIAPDDTQDDLLVMRGDGTLARRSIGSIESPWLFAEILVGTDSMLAICPDSDVIGQISVDVIDLNGNLRIGDNAYIDDDLDYGDDGDNDDIPDDWMKFNDRLEFRSSHDDYGLVLFDKTSFTNFLNLHHSSGTSYLSNSNKASNFFMKSTGRNVTFGGAVTIPELITTNYQSSGNVNLIADLNNNGSNNRFVFGSGGAVGSANYNELLRIEENGRVFIRNLTSSNNYDQVLVRNSVGGRLFARDASSIGPWTIEESGNLLYDLGDLGLNITESPTETIDIGLGTVRIREMETKNWIDDLVLIDGNGRLVKRNTSTLNLSPWDVSSTYLNYDGNIGIGLSTSDPSQSIDVNGTARLRGLASNTLEDALLVTDATGVVYKRNINTFSPWAKVANNSYYSEGRLGIGVANNDNNVSTQITTGLKTSLSVISSNTQSGTYGIRSEVISDDAKAIAAVNSTTGNDVFRVYGNGIVEAKEVLVSVDIWNDYVFKPKYDLMPLEKVEEFVNKNYHLPEIPSEKEVLEEGVNLGEMEGLLLKKVEELTLYLIEQNKQLKEQSELLKVQAAKIEKLEKKLN